MSKKPRRHYTTEQKVALLKRHMVDKVPVSDLCDQENLPPSVFYRWQSQLFENLAGAFSTPAAANGPSKRDRRIIAVLTAATGGGELWIDGAWIDLAVGDAVRLFPDREVRAVTRVTGTHLMFSIGAWIEPKASD